MVSETLIKKEANTSQLLCCTKISRLDKDCGRENYFSIWTRQKIQRIQFSFNNNGHFRQMLNFRYSKKASL